MLYCSLQDFRLLTAVVTTVLGTCATANSESSVAEPLSVRYLNVPEDRIYVDRFEYFSELIKMIMEKSGTPYRTEAVNIPPVPTSRNVMYLKQDRFNVSWIHTDRRREHDLRPIRIPIFRGLIGWRLFLIREDKKPAFDAIQNIDDLKALKAGQVHDWPDVPILKKSGFSMRTSHSWLGTYNLLVNNRVDYFPRGLVEVWDEMEKIKNKEIDVNLNQNTAIEGNIALKYPTAFYIFVTKENEALAQAIETGFENAIQDGSFNKVFMKYFGRYIEKSRLTERVIYSIPNPNLTEETPLERSELWFSVDELQDANSN